MTLVVQALRAAGRRSTLERTAIQSLAARMRFVANL